MTTALEAPPVLSTPDTHIFEEPTAPAGNIPRLRLSDEEIHITYEIERTVREIKEGRWQRIALQFSDDLLVDAPKVFEALSRGLKRKTNHDRAPSYRAVGGDNAVNIKSVTHTVEGISISSGPLQQEERLYILADTSYGACCVDEIAAEHVDADVVVHYGRACLSPTARLPVIYVFTHRSLRLDSVVQAFTEAFPDPVKGIILMADVTHMDHIPELFEALKGQGYSNLFATSLIRDPSSPLPNRTVPQSVSDDTESLKDWQLFHIDEPPSSLLLTLSSRLAAIHIFPTADTSSMPSSKSFVASTSMRLRRRYALLTSLSSVSIFGILINTLSVKNYLHIVQHVQAQILAAGKKSYTFVVGKINAAKVANFSEVGGWVVIGCWESSLVESKDFWKPLITPFELELALRGDEDRVWTGQWRGDFQGILDEAGRSKLMTQIPNEPEHIEVSESLAENSTIDGGDLDSEPESAPPDFDLRGGRYVSHTRPMQNGTTSNIGSASQLNGTTKSLIRRINGELATVGGEVSPAAEYLNSKRTWKGLGSDFEIAYDEAGTHVDINGTSIEQGRSGIARGYSVGEEASKR
ncbi:Diphthamide biosynthesis protein 2 [Acarospora aff. strigata]|nr:Diphthamide biosynthesis protein 2 [Acarospora aff. strigata]